MVLGGRRAICFIVLHLALIFKVSVAETTDDRATSNSANQQRRRELTEADGRNDAVLTAATTGALTNVVPTVVIVLIALTVVFEWISDAVRESGGSANKPIVDAMFGEPKQYHHRADDVCESDR